MEFFVNYECLLKSWKVTAERVYNVDETGVSSVVQYHNIVALIGTKQVVKAVCLVNEELCLPFV